MINCKVELKLKWEKYCVLAAAGFDNVDEDSDNIIVSIKDTDLYVLVGTLSANGNQKLSKLLGKGFERSVYWNEYKTKSESEYINFLEWRLFVLIHSSEDVNGKRFKAGRYYLPKGIFKNYNVRTNGKNFYNEPFDSAIKRYEEVRNLTIGQGEHCTTGNLLDYEYIKSHYKLIAVDLIRPKEIDVDSKEIRYVEFVRQLKNYMLMVMLHVQAMPNPCLL